MTANVSFFPTRNWAVSWYTVYSITQNEFGTHSLNFKRDLYRWQANFDFIRAPNGNTSFSFSVHLTDLPDLKAEFNSLPHLRGTVSAARTSEPDTANSQFDFAANGATGSASGIADNKWYSIEFYYDESTAFTATVQGAAAAAPTAVTISGAPGAGTVGSARLGALTAATAADTMKFDEFESTRSTTTAIGRLCRGDSNGDAQIGVGDAISIGNEFAGTLASGQPDCNEDGQVGVGDAICVGNRFAATGSSCS